MNTQAHAGALVPFNSERPHRSFARRHLLAAALCATLAATAQVQATHYTASWTGAVSNSWTTAGNWSGIPEGTHPNNVGGDTFDVLITNGGAPIIAGDFDPWAASFGGVTINVGSVTMDSEAETASLLTIYAGSELIVSSGNTFTQGMMSAVDLHGTLTAPTVNLNGCVSGSGTINGNVVGPSLQGSHRGIWGGLESYGYPDAMTVTGNYTAGANGGTIISILNCNSSVLEVGGVATLDGGLNLIIRGYTPGDMPSDGQQFTVLRASSIVGQFSRFRGVYALDNHPYYDWSISYLNNEVVVTAHTPEPATVCMLVLGATGLLRRRNARHRTAKPAA